MLQMVQQLPGCGFLLRVANPHLGQALVGWQFTRRTAQELPLDTRLNPLRLECLCP